MEQDLFSWLNSQRKTNDTGLLVAPLSQNSESPLENHAHENQITVSDSQQQDTNAYSQDYDSDSRQQESPAYVNGELAKDFHRHEDTNAYSQSYDSESRQQDSRAYVNDESARNFQQHEDLSAYPQDYDSESQQQDSSAYVNDESAKSFHQHEDTNAYPQDYDPDSQQQESPAYVNDESAKDFQRHEDLSAYSQDHDSESNQEESPAYINDESAKDFQQHEDTSAYPQDYDPDSQQQESPAYVNDESAKDFQRHEDLSAYFQDYDSESQRQDLPAYVNDEPAKDFQRHEDLSAYPQDYDSESQRQESPAYVNDEPANEDDILQTLPPEAVSYGDDEIPQDHDWQERATGFTLSLDEPPPELWTHINDDDPDPEYEATDSLQGAAYVQIHGRNFTERLHHTLKHRKERAEERAQAENDNPPSKTLMQMAVILCGTLVIVMGFACLSLWFVWRETPDGMKRRAESFIESGNFDEASEIYRKAHRRYPNEAEFLARLSESSEKAGHHQTAKAAREEYQNKTESKDIPPKPEIKPQTFTRHIIPEEKPMTFKDYLDEGNYAYNIGMYNRAVIYFSRAMSINSRDIRPYLGLAACYRMKGMYFDSNRILEEARRIFGRSPAIDMGIYFLREAK